MAIVRGYKGNWAPDRHPLMLIDMETQEFLGFQGLPQELDYDPEPSWASIKVPGRNGPWYNYVGSEDTLTLEVSWYAKQENRKDVIAKCRWVESLSKSDSYNDPPHRVRLKWGELYSDDIWIVAKAGYKVSLFAADQGYLPGLATQIIVLKKWLPYNSNQQQINGEILVPMAQGTKIELSYNNLYAGGSIIEYGDGDYTLEPGTERYPPKLDDETYNIKDGDTLTNIAHEKYMDSKLWHVLAKANDIDDPLTALASGLILRVPNLPGIILKKSIF